jgi:hypothetical protein
MSENQDKPAESSRQSFRNTLINILFWVLVFCFLYVIISLLSYNQMLLSSNSTPVASVASAASQSGGMRLFESFPSFRDSHNNLKNITTDFDKLFGL